VLEEVDKYVSVRVPFQLCEDQTDPSIVKAKGKVRQTQQQLIEDLPSKVEREGSECDCFSPIVEWQ